MPRLAANLSMMFAERPFGERFAAAAAAGFRGVEYLFPYEAPAATVADWQQEAGVATVLFNLPPGNWSSGERGLAALPGREAEFAASIETALAYAEALAVPRLHCMAGIVSPGADRERHRRCYVANLRLAARALAAAGRTLLIEPINHRDMPGYALRTLEEALAIRDEVAEPNLMIQADLYHCQIEGGDLSRRITAALPAIGHVQLAGVPDRHEPDLGEWRHDHLLTLLDDVGYDGWVGCEYRPRGETEAGLGWAAPWLDPPA